MNSRNPCFIRLCFAITKAGWYTCNGERSRNPCFIRLCFAIEKEMTYEEFRNQVAILVLLDYVLQSISEVLVAALYGRNPCFIRLCFAIMKHLNNSMPLEAVAILVLLDYVLQCFFISVIKCKKYVSQSLFY